MLLSSVLFTVPWFGYQYVWEMEKYLRFGQEQTILGSARALATALHERPNLFNNQASFLPSVEQGKDFYGYELKQAIQLDGLPNDWPNYDSRIHLYNQQNSFNQVLNTQDSEHKFTATIAKYGKYLYLFISVVDNNVIFRAKNAQSIVNNDHLEIALVDHEGIFNRYVIANKQVGWLDSYRITNLSGPFPEVANFIQGHWLTTPQGYNIELRVPLTQVGDQIAFAVHDVDSPGGEVISSIGSADPSQKETLGTIVVPSPEIERIVKGMSHTNSRIWVVDQHKRVLASAGDLTKAGGVWQRTRLPDENLNTENQSLWQKVEQQWLIPLYYKFLTKPPKAFIDNLYDTQNLTGQHIETALIGEPSSQWRLTKDQQAVVLSAAYPIFINQQVHGAVIVEETTNGIRTLRNKALEKLFSAIIAILLISAVVFLLFASRISNRISRLRNQAEHAIDENGRITANITASTANDEIGDLSRSFSQVVNRLSQYNQYLEGMSSRLSHELRTPIAVVRTSLENLSLHNIPQQSQQYIDRAQGGISRLNAILTSMSEATRIEQMLISSERVNFDFNQVLNGCIQGYQQVYNTINFHFNASDKALIMNGSPEHIAQLFDKVIANAAEFTTDQQIFITTEDHAKEIVVHISNNGMLLPEQMHERLFDSMVSVRENSKDTQPHLGLGLYIARLICQFHQGKIKASNHHNPQGVTITMSFPKA
ncbi:proteobacterial dedicated sortase system histidine kinase [Thalassotalea profundi]|uniref:histidine kinase n=1 Tax=Thalassotalea profundi TaxID=2036687 RepID=A0ABQ3IK14_9GAMM|nr:proteobacterial dedicated sortase system histidine kinase [Thalassotalea profundi]